MAMLLSAIILSLLSTSGLIEAQTTAPASFRTLCYVEGWTHWREEPAKFEPSDIDTRLCTHVAWNYAELDPSGTHIIPQNRDTMDYHMWQELTGLKQQNPDLKVLLTVGGWGLGSEEFSAMSSDPAKTQQFVTNAIKLLRSYRFDGLVIDWDFPATRGDPPEDKHHLTELLQAIQQGFANDATETNRPRLLLVATITPDPWQISQSYELPDIASYVDWLDVKAFGLHGTWETTSAHHSSLYSTTGDETDSIHYMVQNLISMNVPRGKMTLGIAFYGVAENMTDPTDTDLGSPISGGAEGGPIIHETGILAYFEVKAQN